MSGHLLLYSPKTKAQLPVGQILRDALYHVTTASSQAEFESYAPHRIWDCLIILGGSPSLLHQLSTIIPNQKMPIIVVLEAQNAGCRMQFLRARADEIFATSDHGKGALIKVAQLAPSPARAPRICAARRHKSCVGVSRNQSRLSIKTKMRSDPNSP